MKKTAKRESYSNNNHSADISPRNLVNRSPFLRPYDNMNIKNMEDRPMSFRASITCLGFMSARSNSLERQPGSRSSTLRSNAQVI